MVILPYIPPILNFPFSSVTVDTAVEFTVKPSTGIPSTNTVPAIILEANALVIPAVAADTTMANNSNLQNATFDTASLVDQRANTNEVPTMTLHPKNIVKLTASGNIGGISDKHHLINIIN